MRSLINFTGDYVAIKGMCFGGGRKVPQDRSVEAEQMRISAAERERQQQQDLINRDMQSLAENPNAGVTTQQAIARQQQLQQQARETEARNRFNTARDTAIAGARGTASTELTRRRLDPSRYGGLLNQEVDRIATTIPDLAENPGTFFDPSFVDRVLNNEQTATRDRNTRTVRGQFGEGFERNAVGDTSDDAILDSILGEQYGTARSTIDRARERGDLNDVGYTSALGSLDKAKDTGRTTLTG